MYRKIYNREQIILQKDIITHLAGVLWPLSQIYCALISLSALSFCLHSKMSADNQLSARSQGCYLIIGPQISIECLHL